jgi:undecaprenyl-diphosphatase
MTNVDHAILFFLNQFAQRWPGFDNLVVMLSESDLLKGGIVVAAVWCAWFYRSNEQHKFRAQLLAAIAGALVALFIARMLAFALPLRMRPILDPALHFRPPSGLPDQSNWTTWSSFPSDHAALFFALTLGVFRVSRKGGIILFVYVLIFICLPRMYVGIHYPTDILAGLAIGFAASALLAIERINRLWTTPVFAFLERKPALFYALFFFLSFQIATLFWDIRVLLGNLGFSV